MSDVAQRLRQGVRRPGHRAGPAQRRRRAGDRRRLRPRCCARGGRGPTIVIAHDMRPSSPGLAAAFADGAAAEGADVVDGRARLDRHAVLRLRHAGPARRDVHRAATTRPSTTASRCAGPGRCRSARTPGWPRSATWPRPSWTAPPPLPADARRARRASGTCSRVRRVPARPGRPVRHPAAEVVVDAGNGMGGYTVPAVLGDGARRAAADDRAALLRAGRHVPQPRGQPAGAGEPRRPADGGRRARRRHRARLRRRRRPLLRHRRARRAGLAERGHRAGRHPGAGQAPGRHDHPQPDHVQRGAGDRHRERRRSRSAPGSGTRSSRPRWPGPARSSAASTRRTTTSATSGAPTPACWPRCTCWPRSAASRCRCPSSPPTFERYVASGEINSTVADPAGEDWPRSRRRSPPTPRQTDHLDGLTATLRGRQLVQPAAVQHRAAAAAERRGADRRADGELRDDVL